MQTAQSEIHSGTANPSQFAQSAGGTAVAPGTASGVNLADYKIIRRNGAVVSFEPSKIAVAMTKAFLAVNGGQGAASARVRELVDQQTQNVVRALLRSRPNGGTFHIEDVQDQVELALMRSGEHDVARAYVLYRERRAQERAQAGETQQQPAFIGLNVTDGGISRPLDMVALRNVIVSACEGLGDAVDPEPILKETVKNLYEGVPMTQVYDSAILASRTLIEKDPAYSQVTARILLHTIRREILGEEVTQAEMSTRYVDYFPQFIKRGWPSSTWPAWARRWTPRATSSSTTSACRRCTTATSCTSTKPASRCRRHSSCVWRWAWR
jgi:ribonucleoside-diphosphate reductase alpha chain